MSLRRILVIGATGHFGGRICRRLAEESHLHLIVASRNRDNAEALARELRQGGRSGELSGAAVDQDSDTLSSDIAKLAPFLVIHTAGPYQGQDYRVAEACVQAGCHYIDLADGRKFVEMFASLDARARERGVLLVSGASTLPGISTAVVDELGSHFKQIDAIEMSIAPAHQTPRGTGTIGAVLSYCGQPFKVLTNGSWVQRYGWQNLRLQRYPDIGRRLSAACDVPDLSLIPASVPTVKTVTFHAALEAPWEQVSLWLMAWLTRFRIVRSWQSFIPVFATISRKTISLGSKTGGMHIRCSGISLNDKPLATTWFLVARENHGPEIPCTPAIVLARKLVAGDLVETGATACQGLFSLDEIVTALSGYEISTDIHEDGQ